MYTWPSEPVRVTVIITTDEEGCEVVPEVVEEASEEREDAEVWGEELTPELDGELMAELDEETPLEVGRFVGVAAAEEDDAEVSVGCGVDSEEGAAEVGVAGADVGAAETALFPWAWARLAARESSKRALSRVAVLVFILMFAGCGVLCCVQAVVGLGVS